MLGCEMKPFAMYLVAVLYSLSLPAQDWPQRGGSSGHNPVVANLQFRAKTRQGKPDVPLTRWIAQLGSKCTGEPVISNGLVWVGTNNDRPRDAGQTNDASVLMCFRESDGQFLYQYVSPRLPSESSRLYDWPEASLASSPLVEGNRLWFCTNRCEVVCLDISALLDGTGPPSVQWKYDMFRELGVRPRAIMFGSHSSHSSVIGYRDFIYVNTTNGHGVDSVSVPEAPALICLTKSDGTLQWRDNSSGNDFIYIQHGNPTLIEIDGHAQIVMGQADGCVRSFDALTGALLWKFDINLNNPSKHVFPCEPYYSVAMPVFHNRRLYVAGGPEGEGNNKDSTLFCLDPTRRGDISEELLNEDKSTRPNPNSGVVWKFLGHGTSIKDRMHATLSNVVVHNGLVIVPDGEGFVHCLEEATGAWLWTHDCWSGVVGAPLIIGDRVYIGGEDGHLTVLKLARELQLIEVLSLGNSSVECAPTFANGTLFVATRRELFAIEGE